MNFKKSASVICVLSAGILWGSMGIFVRTLQSDFNFSSMQIVALRLVTAAAAFIISAFIKGFGKIKIKLGDAPLLFAMGFFGVTLMSVFYFMSMTYASLSVAAILLYTAPAFVMTASVFLFKERLGKLKIISLILALTGFVFVSGILDSGAAFTGIGILAGLASGITYGSYSIFGTYALKKHDNFTVTVWVFIFAALSSLLFADIPDIAAKISASENIFKLAAVVICMGIVTAFLPYILYTAGLSKMDASKAVILASVEPLTATVLGFVVFSETPTFFSLAGIILILASVVLTASKKEN